MTFRDKPKLRWLIECSREEATTIAEVDIDMEISRFKIKETIVKGARSGGSSLKVMEEQRISKNKVDTINTSIHNNNNNHNHKSNN